MSVQGFVLIRMDQDVAAQQCSQMRLSLESIGGVVRVDDVLDVESFDTLAWVDAPVMIDCVADRIKQVPGVASVQAARVMAPPQF